MVNNIFERMIKIINVIKDKLDLHNDKCFQENNKNGKCYGSFGGTKYTNYLSEHCIDCKHLTYIDGRNLEDE